MNQSSPVFADAPKLRRRAEARLRDEPGDHQSRSGVPESPADTRRLLHELQVHQIELEVQNGELQQARDETEALLEKYTDLYNFAPVGCFSLDEQGRIMDANLTGAALLGIERSRLLNHRFPRFVGPAGQAAFLAFLERVFADNRNHVCETPLLRANAMAFWAALHGAAALAVSGRPKWCRLAVSDITPLKEAAAAQRRMEALTITNQELEREIVRRQAVEESLRKSEQHYGQLLEESRRMEGELRLLSRQFLSAQEEERKKISRELHDVIAQTLAGINVRLANLKKTAASDTRGQGRDIARAQRLVERSVKLVHQFARELRPTALDDLGLIPALHTLMKRFTGQTGIRVSLSASAVVERLDDERRVALYRVAQEALTNVARHSQASRADVKIQKFKGAISLEIKDNGKGFHQHRVFRAKESQRLGLIGMRERLEMVGGNLVVTSSPTNGTLVLAQVPLVRANSRKRAANRADRDPRQPSS